jgi:hypothetical protein
MKIKELVRPGAMIALIGIIALLYSCSPSTEITGTWKNPNVSAAVYDNILIASMSSKVNVKQEIENNLAAELSKQGVQAYKGIEVLPPSFRDNPDKNEMLKKIRGTSANAILTVSLIDTETENRYVPGNVTYAPVSRFGYYGRFWGYYNYWNPIVTSPGYYTEDKTYFLETNLYDVDTEELVWSAQSETYNPSSLSQSSQEFAKIIVDKLKADGVIRSR